MQATLDAQANERKARLAKLRSLKRKHPADGEGDDDGTHDPSRRSVSPPPETKTTTKYLSGRNYDAATRGPKLGFEQPPTEGQLTLEEQAAAIATETARLQVEEEKAEKPVDLFNLQPKKANWDLKRDLERKLEVLNVRTENAIARLVRQRVQAQQEKARRADGPEREAAGDGEQTGIDGMELVEGVHQREREDREERDRERDEDEM